MSDYDHLMNHDFNSLSVHLFINISSVHDMIIIVWDLSAIQTIVCWHTCMLKAFLMDKRKIASLFLQTADEHQFYLPKDTLLKLDMFANDVGFLSSYWGCLGRPLLIFPVSTNLNYLGLNVWLINIFAEWSLFLQHFLDGLKKQYLTASWMFFLNRLS